MSNENQVADLESPTEPKFGTDEYEAEFWKAVELREKEKQSPVPLEYSSEERAKREAKKQAEDEKGQQEDPSTPEGEVGDEEPEGETPAPEAGDEPGEAKEEAPGNPAKPKLKEELATQSWYDNLSDEAKKEVHRLAMNERAAVGRTAHLQRTVDELKRQMQQLIPRANQPASTNVPVAQPAKTAPSQVTQPPPRWEELKAKDPEYAEAVEQRLQWEREQLTQHINSQLADTISPLQQGYQSVQERLQIEQETRTLDSQAPFWREVQPGGQLREAFDTWKQYLSPQDQQILSSSTRSDELIPYLQGFWSAYQMWNQQQAQAAQPPASEAKPDKADKIQAQRQAKLNQAPPSPSAPKTVRDPKDENDPDALFEKAAREADARLKQRSTWLK